MEEGKEPVKKNPKITALFFITVFSLLIAMTSAITQPLVAISFQIVLIFTQLILTKSLLDSYMPSE